MAARQLFQNNLYLYKTAAKTTKRYLLTCILTHGANLMVRAFLLFFIFHQEEMEYVLASVGGYVHNLTCRS